MTADRKTVTEWRVETETLEDEFGTNEAEAREWLARCESNRDWEPAVLMSRTVATETTPWSRVEADSNCATTDSLVHIDREVLRSLLIELGRHSPHWRDPAATSRLMNRAHEAMTGDVPA